MRKIIFMAAALWFACSSLAQNLQSGEYFFDTDPGVGKGNPIVVTPADTVSMPAFLVSTTGLTPGFHLLHTRFRNSNDIWSLIESRPFWLDQFFVGSSSIVAAEYFFDNDPGVGKANPITIGTAGDSISLQSLAVPTAGLGSGFHLLSIRLKNSNGFWSLIEPRPFWLEQIMISNSMVTAAEYFIDSDPGVGKGIQLPITPAETVSQTAGIALAGISPGFHNLGIRVKNSDEVWSLFEPRSFYVVPYSDQQRQIVAAEYFVDTDPGTGNASPITVPAPTAMFDATLALSIPQGLSNGQHFLMARVKDNLGRWSLLAVDTFTVDNTLPVTGMQLSVTGTANGHLLQWFTLSENNTRHFDIEHSMDGISFSKIGETKAAGNSQVKKDYSFLHHSSVPGLHYYRLKQADANGRYQYSNIALIEIREHSYDLLVYPNPATNYINFILPGASQATIIASIYTQYGQQILLQRAVSKSINISSLPAGTYYLHVTDGQQRFSQQFIKK